MELDQAREDGYESRVGGSSYLAVRVGNWRNGNTLFCLGTVGGYLGCGFDISDPEKLAGQGASQVSGALFAPVTGSRLPVQEIDKTDSFGH